jgi:hypothetical protein
MKTQMQVTAVLIDTYQSVTNALAGGLCPRSIASAIATGLAAVSGIKRAAE